MHVCYRYGGEHFGPESIKFAALCNGQSARRPRACVMKANPEEFTPRANPEEWVSRAKVAARIVEGALEVRVDGITTQAKYYKPLVRDFFRKDYGRVRPLWGDMAVHIVMEHTGEAPWMDLDNLAKALLDAITGVAFHDDSQVARLLVERRAGERDRIFLTARPL